MTTRLLFPHRYRLIGWAIFVPFAILGLATMYADFELSWLSFGPVYDFLGSKLADTDNLTNELAGLGSIAGLMLIAFSREPTEDEMISRLRLEALQWSVYANYLILTLAMVTMYDGAFFVFMVYNMFTVLLVFIGRFRWLIYRNTQLLSV